MDDGEKSKILFMNDLKSFFLRSLRIQTSSTSSRILNFNSHRKKISQQMGELFASDVKGVASAIAVMFNWTLVFIITKTFGMMKESWGTGEFELEVSQKTFF